MVDYCNDKSPSTLIKFFLLDGVCFRKMGSESSIPINTTATTTSGSFIRIDIR
jgi:hypothetical protein